MNGVIILIALLLTLAIGRSIGEDLALWLWPECEGLVPGRQREGE